MGSPPTGEVGRTRGEPGAAGVKARKERQRWRLARQLPSKALIKRRGSMAYRGYIAWQRQRMRAIARRTAARNRSKPAAVGTTGALALQRQRRLRALAAYNNRGQEGEVGTH